MHCNVVLNKPVNYTENIHIFKVILNMNFLLHDFE